VAESGIRDRDDARRLADPRRQRAGGKRDADALWGHS